MRDAIKGVVIGLFLLALFAALATRSGWITSDFPRPEGQGAWMFSRATGLLAYVAVSIDVIVGLLVSTRSAVVPRGDLVDVHRWLSPIGLALVFAHGGVLLVDGYARFDIIDLVIPFASQRWPLAIGLGIVASYLLLVVHLSFGFRKRLGTALWRRLHYLSFASFVVVTVHALAVGTDRANPWFASVYAAIAVTVAVLLGIRIRGERGRKNASIEPARP